MQISNEVEVLPSISFADVWCKKHRQPNKMIELDNGWFRTCWYCQSCNAVYELGLKKIRKVNRENLDNILKEKGIL